MQCYQSKMQLAIGQLTVTATEKVSLEIGTSKPVTLGARQGKIKDII